MENPRVKWLVAVRPLDGSGTLIHSEWPWQWLARFMASWIAPQYLRVSVLRETDGVINYIDAKRR